MIELIGKYNSAKVFADNIEESARFQILELLDNSNFADSKIRFMSDVHAGNGCVIGTTMTITDKIVPNFVGVDIGCGVLAERILEYHIDFDKLDSVIKQFIPSGFAINNTENHISREIDLSKLKCVNHVNVNRAYKSIGTLGGGNHFIEVAKDICDWNRYLIIHSGSRNLGKQIAEYYQKEAYKQMKDNQLTKIDKSMSYCTGYLMDDYLHDMDIAQKCASLNRKAIAGTILHHMGLPELNESSIETVHNYIDMDTMILRKGAVRADKNETVIIPMNMSFGSIIGIGKGNSDWNNSCAHGSGRIMSRTEARKNVSLEDYRESMDGIFSTCVNTDTIDESPMAYKEPNSIIEQLKDTVCIVEKLKPMYNFKASESQRSGK